MTMTDLPAPVPAARRGAYRLAALGVALALFLGSAISGLAMAGPSAALEADPRAPFDLSLAEKSAMQKESLLAIDYIQQYHYKRKPFNEIPADELIRNTMEAWDYHHLFFTAQDEREMMGRFGATLKPVYLSKGELYPAFEIFYRYRARALDRFDWVAHRLEGEFDFDREDTYQPDRSELDWPADADAAEALWEKRLTYDLLQEMLGGDSLERAKEKISRRYERSRRYVEDLEPHEVQEVFLGSLANLYDPHTTFYSADSWEEFSIGIRNSLVGIGAILRDEDGYCVLQELVPGGPAEMSGQLHPGDKIVAVAQGNGDPVDVVDMKLSKVVQLIRGVKGTEVVLTIIPGSASDPSERRIVRIIRDEIKLTAKLARASVHEVPLDDQRTGKVGVIDLPSFYGPAFAEDGSETSTTSEDVEELIGKLKGMGIDGLVLDLRRNGGGLLSEAVNVTGLFIPEGPVVQVRDTTGRVVTHEDENRKVAWEGPLVVLVSRHSASASEIVAGALQNHARALVVGDNATHGKGTVQALFQLGEGLRSGLLTNLPDLGATKVTIQKFYLPNGDSTQNKGVVSDVALPNFNQYLEIGESDLPNALAWDEIDPLDWDTEDASVPRDGMVRPSLLEAVRAASAYRQNQLEEFQYLQENIDWFRERQDRKEFSLDLATRKAQREADEAFRDKMDERREDLRRFSYPSEEINLAITDEKEAQHQEKLATSTLPDGRAKANAYFQKVYYYEHDDGTIAEIFVEALDYDKAKKEVARVATVINDELDVTIDEEALSDLLGHFENADPGNDFNVERTFAQYLGEELTKAQIDQLLPAFFRVLTEIDEQILEDAPLLDIPLRESLRIVGDWILFNEGALADDSLAIATEHLAPAATRNPVAAPRLD